ncbi:MAG: hypothetical protein RPR28_12015 [Cycloclasticus sp.]|nr:hypothetical protein A9Q82_01765 [Cycloclasticus sp. 46_120_T64]
MDLSLFELISLSTQLHTQLYEHWAVFISLHLALLGGLFAFDLNIKTGFKISFLLFYGLFAGINLAVSINLLNQVAAIVSDLNSLGAEQSQLAVYLQQEDLAYSRPVLIFTHLITGLMVLLGLFIPSKK